MHQVEKEKEERWGEGRSGSCRRRHRSLSTDGLAGCSSDSLVNTTTATYSSRPPASRRAKSHDGKTRRYIRTAEPRLRWSSDLHKSFERAVQHLGGHKNHLVDPLYAGATPKAILQVMDVKGLTIAQVKSHLQMFRSPKSGKQFDRQFDDFESYLRSSHRLDKSNTPASDKPESNLATDAKKFKEAYPSIWENMVELMDKPAKSQLQINENTSTESLPMQQSCPAGDINTIKLQKNAELLEQINLLLACRERRLLETGGMQHEHHKPQQGHGQKDFHRNASFFSDHFTHASCSSHDTLEGPQGQGIFSSIAHEWQCENFAPDSNQHNDVPLDLTMSVGTSIQDHCETSEGFTRANITTLDLTGQLNRPAA